MDKGEEGGEKNEYNKRKENEDCRIRIREKEEKEKKNQFRNKELLEQYKNLTLSKTRPNERERERLIMPSSKSGDSVTLKISIHNPNFILGLHTDLLHHF